MGEVTFTYTADENRINKALLSDLKTAADACGFNINVGTAITGHSYYTKGGNISRHGSGNAVDINEINGHSYSSNKSLFTMLGNRLSQEFISMGYSKNVEIGNTKAVLWGFSSKQGGNHFNHLHVSNKSSFKSISGSYKKDVNSLIISSNNNSQIDDEFHSDEDYYEENVSQLFENKVVLANGIWQIIKFIIDPNIINRQINDLSLSTYQGSLLNFINQICQVPFVEFWGDTYGDQYYFIARTPPFTLELYKTLPTIDIYDKDVLGDNFDFCNENYSWFQLTPSANYIGVEEWLHLYLPAVFFPEYAEIYGSKPLSITSQYISYIKETGEIQKEKAIYDLKYLVDIHSYLPFTRKGVITINLNRRIKKGMRIKYLPTNEYFYVDSVSHSFDVLDGVIDATTTITVSRGMVTDYVDNDIEDNTTPNYFNLINFDKNNTKKNTQSNIKDNIYHEINSSMNHHIANFNYNYSTFDYTNFLDTLDEFKELLLTKEDVDNNFKNIDNLVDFVYNYKNLEFEIIGYTDNEGNEQFNSNLGIKRATTVLNILASRYSIKFGEDENLFKKRFYLKSEGESKPKVSNDTINGRKQNRRVEIYIKGMSPINSEQSSKNKEPLLSPQDGNWRVNIDVFLFFLKRRQFLKGGSLLDTVTVTAERIKK